MKKVITFFATFILILLLLGVSLAEVSSAFPLQQGEYNNTVIALHNKLSSLGLYSLRPESPFSSQSENALKLLQGMMGIAQTGIIEDKDQLDSILSVEVGSLLAAGGNILYNSGAPEIGKSDFENGIWRSASGGSGAREVVTIDKFPIAGIENGFHFIGSTEDSKSTDVAIDAIPLELGETYVLSCYAKGTGKFHIQHGKNPYPRETFEVTSDWQLYSIEFVIGDNDGSTEESPSTNIYFGVPAGAENDVTICGMSLVKK